MADNRKKPLEKRRSRRIPVQFYVEFDGKNVEGWAHTSNISTSGALLDEAEPLLLAGGEIRLRFALLPDAVPIELCAEVVRETETGFAVRFTEMDPRVKSVLRMAIAKARKAANQDSQEPERRKTLLVAPKPRENY